jgi:hypothetical protein
MCVPFLLKGGVSAIALWSNQVESTLEKIQPPQIIIIIISVLTSTVSSSLFVAWTENE